MPKPSDIVHVSPIWNSRKKVEPYGPDYSAINPNTKRGKKSLEFQKQREEREALARKLGLKKG